MGSVHGKISRLIETEQQHQGKAANKWIKWETLLLIKDRKTPTTN